MGALRSPARRKLFWLVQVLARATVYYRCSSRYTMRPPGRRHRRRAHTISVVVCRQPVALAICWSRSIIFGCRLLIDICSTKLVTSCACQPTNKGELRNRLYASSQAHNQSPLLLHWSLARSVGRKLQAVSDLFSCLSRHREGTINSCSSRLEGHHMSFFAKLIFCSAGGTISLRLLSRE